MLHLNSLRNSLFVYLIAVIILGGITAGLTTETARADGNGQDPVPDPPAESTMTIMDPPDSEAESGDTMTNDYLLLQVLLLIII